MASALAKSAEASPHANSDPPQWLYLERWIDLLVSEDDDIGNLQAGEFFDVASRALVCEQDRRPTRLDIRADLGADRVEDLFVGRADFYDVLHLAEVLQACKIYQSCDSSGCFYS